MNSNAIKSVPYRVYYGILPSRQIFNCLEVQEQYRDRKNERNKFYIKLEQSVLAEGFRNPILIIAGFCPDVYKRKLPSEMREDANKMLICAKLGGSRLWVAQQHDLDIPCIISDFGTAFAHRDLVEIKTEVQIKDYFTDKPKWVSFGRHGVTTSTLDHYHLR